SFALQSRGSQVSALSPYTTLFRSRVQYARVFEGGRRHGDALLGLHWLPAATPPRFGLAVSRKVDPRAVGRNRIKRVLRENVRHLDRKSTRLNSSHVKISYAVFCLK